MTSKRRPARENVSIFTMAKNEFEMEIYSKIGIKSMGKTNEAARAAEARGAKKLVCVLGPFLHGAVVPNQENCDLERPQRR